MNRVSFQTLLFAILSLIFIILITFLSSDFPSYPLISYQDALDVFTPMVLLSIYWLLFKNSSKGNTTRRQEITFMIFAAFWVEGQGMHLSANSINNLIGKLAENQVIDITSTDIYHLTYFFDEHLGHILWHIGILGLAALLIYREWRLPSGEATVWWPVIVAGIIYGFSYFAIFLEGQTTLIGYPFATVMAAWTLISQRKNLAQRPVLAFFFITCLVAFLFFTGWGLYWGGFPQPSDVGIP